MATGCDQITSGPGPVSWPRATTTVPAVPVVGDSWSERSGGMSAPACWAAAPRIPVQSATASMERVQKRPLSVDPIAVSLRLCRRPAPVDRHGAPTVERWIDAFEPFEPFDPGPGHVTPNRE